MRPIRAACLGTATLVALLTCTSVAGAAAADTGSAQTTGKARVITLTGVVQEVHRFPVSTTPGVVSQGDRVVVRSILSDLDGNEVGETNGTCTTTRGGSDEAEQCLVTYTLADGQLVVAGMFYNYLDPDASFDNAITGGTGRYDKARGSVHAELLNGVRTFTISLV